MSGTTDHEEALLDHIMTAPIEVLAAEEDKTVEQLLEEGRQCKERVMASLRRRFPGSFTEQQPEKPHDVP